MNMLTLLVAVAAAIAVGSLVSGISSMATNGEIGHHSSAEWMTLRVVFQALAVLLIVLAVSAPH